MELDGVAVRAFADAAAFEQWLANNYQRQDGIWLKLAKKGSGIPSITSDETVDVGLCYGWISGQRRSYDGSYYLQKYVPRRPNSLWSAVNVEKVENLTAAGRMRPPGIAEVDAAKADGRWAAAYVAQRDATAPEDLVEALEADPAAAEFVATLGKTGQYAVIVRLARSRTPRTRAALLAKLVAGLAAGHVPG